MTIVQLNSPLVQQKKAARMAVRSFTDFPNEKAKQGAIAPPLGMG
jgi:hypothetical protein